MLEFDYRIPFDVELLAGVAGIAPGSAKAAVTALIDAGLSGHTGCDWPGHGKATIAFTHRRGFWSVTASRRDDIQLSAAGVQYDDAVVFSEIDIAHRRPPRSAVDPISTAWVNAYDLAALQFGLQRDGEVSHVLTFVLTNGRWAALLVTDKSPATWLRVRPWLRAGQEIPAVFSDDEAAGPVQLGEGLVAVGAHPGPDAAFAAAAAHAPWPEELGTRREPSSGLVLPLAGGGSERS